MSDRLVTVATFSTALEAHVARTKLESEGIEGFILDENIVGLNWLYSAAVGGVKLKVREDDLPVAQKLLRVEPLDFSLNSATPGPSTANRCPQCFSPDRHRVGRWLARLGFPRCSRCGSTLPH
jgi:hypothetical protein